MENSSPLLVSQAGNGPVWNYYLKQKLIDSFPLIGRYSCQQISSFWPDNRDVQGRNEVRWRLVQETSLPHPCSNLRSFGSTCTVLKKCLWHFWNFLAPAVIRRRGIMPPCPPSLRLWCYAMKIKTFSENKQIIKSERHEHLQFSNTISHGSCADCQQRLLAAFQVSSCSFVSLPCLPHTFFRRGPVFVSLIIKLFGYSTSYFFKVR